VLPTPLNASWICLSDVSRVPFTELAVEAAVLAWLAISSIFSILGWSSASWFLTLEMAITE
jgi:hypothetical protein